MTEAGSQIATQHLEDLRNPFSEAKMEVLPIWEVGETANGLLRLRGDALFTGTLEDGRFRKREQQWFTTSDRVAITGNAIKPLGRADSLVKVMGELVDLEEVERRFMVVCAGRITEGAFAIVAVPDGRMEHALIGVFEGDMVPLCVDEYNSQASGPERMTESFAIEEFPRSSLGKLRRGRLAEIYGKM